MSAPSPPQEEKSEYRKKEDTTRHSSCERALSARVKFECLCGTPAVGEAGASNDGEGVDEGEVAEEVTAVLDVCILEAVTVPFATDSPSSAEVGMHVTVEANTKLAVVGIPVTVDAVTKLASSDMVM